MGRAEPSVVKPPAAFRRDARAKRARATINKVIPTLLAAHPRAKKGIEHSELIVDPPAQEQTSSDEKGKGKGNWKGKKADSKAQKENPMNPRSDSDGLQITLSISDTLTAAKALSESGQGKLGILNMASPLSPGGGFLNGATSQEETLCMQTTLLPALRDEFYRLPELGVIYTPDVLVFRSSSDQQDILPKTSRWFTDVISAAMLRLPETTTEDSPARYANPKDRDLVQQKMRAVLRVFASRGCSHIVLGAWGCGAYGNPVAEIAALWRRVLLPNHDHDHVKSRKKETWAPQIKQVVFAIKDPETATSFARIFGLPIPDQQIPRPVFSDAYEDPTETARITELREKIDELDLRVAQARSPHLRTGLETVLAGLRKQLPCEDRLDGSDMNNDKSDNDYDNDEEQEDTEEGDEVADDGLQSESESKLEHRKDAD